MEKVNDTINYTPTKYDNDQHPYLFFGFWISIILIYIFISIYDKKKKKIKAEILKNSQKKTVLPREKTYSKPENKPIYVPKKIEYLPNNNFAQEITYLYPVVKMPLKDCVIKFSTIGRSNKIGFKENDFFIILNKYFSPSYKVLNDRHIPQKNNSRPYEPDFILINEAKNILINIEIDEPYEGFSRVPTHLINQDNYRDNFFTNRGYIVIRFTEKQIHEECLNCCALISKVILSIDNDYTIPNEINLDITNSENQWDGLTAKNWAKNNYREQYLGIDNFGFRNDFEIEYEPKNSEIDIIIESQVKETVIQNRNKNFGYLGNKNKHSKDEKIIFIEETHQYLINNNPDTISVSQLIDKFFPEFDAYKAASSLNKNHQYYGYPIEEIIEIWRKDGIEQAELGTKLHTQIENFYNQNEYIDIDIEFEYFLNFTQKYPTMLPFRTEWRIYDEQLLIAGTVDMVYKREDGQLFMFDWKRSKKVINNDGTPKLSNPNGNYTEFAFDSLSHLTDDSYNKYCLQQNIYRHILEKNYNVKISSMNLLILHPIYNNYHRLTVPRMENEVNYILRMTNTFR